MNRQGASKETVQRERLSEGDYVYCLYWIRLKDHTCMYEEGYIGITTNMAERVRSHKKNKRHTPLTCAVKKYGWDNLIIDVLYEGLEKDIALELEREYRPSCGIGWNCQQGGNLGVEPEWYSVKENADKHSKATSAATKIGIQNKDSKEDRSKRAKKSWEKTRDKRMKAVKGSNNPRAILNEEQVKTIKYEMMPSGMSNKDIADQFGVKPYVISFIRTGKNWSHI